jgi:DNA-binding Lrp family transcriptional regulator
MHTVELIASKPASAQALERRSFMVTAIVLLRVDREKTKNVAEAIADLDGISEVYSVAGRYDLAVIVRVKTNDDLASITSSETLIAFQVFSRHDLERMFSIGMENP